MMMYNQSTPLVNSTIPTTITSQQQPPQALNNLRGGANNLSKEDSADSSSLNNRRGGANNLSKEDSADSSLNNLRGGANNLAKEDSAGSRLLPQQSPRRRQQP
jgi:hypothetical protein